MKAREWLEAHAAGAVHHEWAELDLTDGVNHVRVRVSADAPRIRDVRHGAGAFAAQQLADGMIDEDGGSPEAALMLTATLIERRHVNASVVLDPIVLPNMPPAEKHSRLVDAAIQSAVPFTAWGAARAQGRALEQLAEVPACVQLYGPRRFTWSVANPSKPFVLDPKCTTTYGVNHGWIVHESQVQWRANRGDGKPGYVWVQKGVPVYASKTLPAFYLIQDRGAAHVFGELADQDDYASAPLFAQGWCLLNGAWTPTRILYTDARYAGLVLPDGKRLESHRHPNVPILQVEPPLTEKPPSASATNPENTTHPTLAQGAHDPDGSTDGPVRTLQRRLLHAGAVLARYGADGDMRGTETVEALRRFQRRAGLTPSGIADAPTWAALDALQQPWVPGIDVSSHQAADYFDWPTIAQTQRWGIARATYGVRADEIFLAVVEAMRAAGMVLGAYHFFHQHQPAEAQITAFFGQLDAAGIGPGDIVPMIDLEDNQDYDGKLDPQAHHTKGRAMVEAVAKRYGRAGIYTTPYHPVNLGLAASAWMLEHDIWIADPTNDEKDKGCPRWPDGWGIWQIGAEHIAGYADSVATKGEGHVIDVNLARSPLPLIGA